jgi:hypothetical protein
VPSADILRRLRPYALGLLVGAGALVAAWIAFGGDESLSADPGIPPPEYVYLDNARVLAYLSQIEGGLTSSEKVSEQVERQRSGGIAASGIQVGGSVSQQQFVERVVTPTATTRFYRLLDRLGAKSYLHTVDVGHGLRPAAKELRDVPEGDFVRVRNCRVRLPTYAQMALAIRASTGPISAFRAYVNTDGSAYATQEALVNAREMGKKVKIGMGTFAEIHKLPGARLTEASARFAAAVGRRPRVALASCTGRLDYVPRGLDLLFPIDLGALNDDPSVLAGPVTIAGKVLRQVRTKSDEYVDDQAFGAWAGPIDKLTDVLNQDADNPDFADMTGELDTDVSVLAPGAVILPIAIYK